MTTESARGGRGLSLADVPERTRVLYLTHHLPWPPISGGRLREAELIARLASRFAIEIVAVSKAPDLDARYLREAARHGCHARVFAAEPSQEPGDSPLARRHRSPQARSYLARYRAGDERVVVHVEGHYLVGLLPPQLRSAALVVDHNIESRLYRQRADLAATEAERRTLLEEAAMTGRAERSAWASAAVVGAVTEDDAHDIRSALPEADVRVIADGADHLIRPAAADSAGLAHRVRMLFVANLGYQPNEDAARALVSEVFPAVTARCPDATLAVVGPAPPRWLKDAGRGDPRIRVTGWVPDVGRWLDAADLVVCPLRIGGGVKVKILEALARGCAIVTTPIGMHGLRYLPANAVAECQDLDAMADACARLLASESNREQLRDRATRAAALLPTWDQAAADLDAAWTALAAQSTYIPLLAGS